MTDAKLNLDGNEYSLPTFSGTENEAAFDISKLRAQSGAITYDPGYGNTGSCKSAITFIDGEKGILRYRGYPIEQLAEKSDFMEVSSLLINGELPSKDELTGWDRDVMALSELPKQLVSIIQTFPREGHPMATLGATIAALSSFFPGSDKDEDMKTHVRRMMGAASSLAAAVHRHAQGDAIVETRPDLDYCSNFLRMLRGKPGEDYTVSEVRKRALNVLLILHADHEQNCSTSTARMVGSSQACLYASMSAAVSALWGPLHGGANQAVLEMLESIKANGGDCKKHMELVKDKNSNVRLMGFGHRVYKNFDPRANILKQSCDEVLDELGVTDPLLDIAKKLEAIALEDDYFVERKLYPNVDFYSGIIYRAMGIPVNMFTVMFALGRMPGWIAHWLEMRDDPDGRIHRPRQIYTGATKRDYPG